MREVVETVWPELVDKLPPKPIIYVTAARDLEELADTLVLNKADEYRAKEECDKRAAQTVDPFIKQQLMEIAEKWRTMAAHEDEHPR
jgi:hypothetical protein